MGVGDAYAGVGDRIGVSARLLFHDATRTRNVRQHAHACARTYASGMDWNYEE